MMELAERIDCIGWTVMRLTHGAFKVGMYDGMAWIYRGDGYEPPVFTRIIPLNRAAFRQWREDRKQRPS